MASGWGIRVFEFGWSPTPDPWATLNSIVHSCEGAGAGTFNGGRHSNAKLDELMDAIRVESDIGRRRQLIGSALRLLDADLPLLPLSQHVDPGDATRNRCGAMVERRAAIALGENQLTPND
jgi:ABC-type transport system substrate-binding protein